MADPQIENGHSDIANELLDAIIKTHFSPAEHTIFWAIVRKTYGWHKKMDRISYTQFEEITGMNRWHIAPALQRLITRGLIIRQGEGYNIEYGIQKDYELWKSLPKSVTNIITDNSNNSLPKTVTNNDSESLPILEKIITDSGETITKNSNEIITDISKHKRNKTITKANIQKIVYGEFKNVLLSKEEYDKLILKFGEKLTLEKIENISEYLESKGKKYNSHYATILNWYRRDNGGGNGKYQGNTQKGRLPTVYTEYPDPAINDLTEERKFTV